MRTLGWRVGAWRRSAGLPVPEHNTLALRLCLPQPCPCPWVQSRVPAGTWPSRGHASCKAQPGQQAAVAPPPQQALHGATRASASPKPRRPPALRHSQCCDHWPPALSSLSPRRPPPATGWCAWAAEACAKLMPAHSAPSSAACTCSCSGFRLGAVPAPRRHCHRRRASGETLGPPPPAALAAHQGALLTPRCLPPPLAWQEWHCLAAQRPLGSPRLPLGPTDFLDRGSPPPHPRISPRQSKMRRTTLSLLLMGLLALAALSE